MNNSLPPAVTLQLPSEVDLEFQWIPAGEFHMGSRGEHSDEEPIHLVKITHGFYLGRYPVTQGQYAVWNHAHENGFPGDLRRPVEQVTWDEAMEYCAWLNDRSQVTWPPGLNEFAAGLPTEAQWEYAWRAGTETEFHTGDGESALAAAGWYDVNSNSTTHPVGCKKPNAYGLHDMHGNVWE
ncbi:MAG: formylglycine-generating enzyme family protein, partial [Planctomycetota bacterium]|nr:formylglycine-generating enzyme family protein [Planctomycetota bacterium]